MYRFQKDMKRVIKKRPTTYYGVDGWEVLVHDVDVFVRGENPCKNCMYEDYIDDCFKARCMDVNQCTRNSSCYYVFVEGYLPNETDKEDRR